MPSSDQPIASILPDESNEDDEEEVQLPVMEEDERQQETAGGSSVFLRAITVEQTVFARNESELQLPLSHDDAVEQWGEEVVVDQEEVVVEDGSSVFLRSNILEQTVFASSQSSQQQESSVLVGTGEVANNPIEDSARIKSQMEKEKSKQHPPENPEILPASRLSPPPVQPETLSVSVPGATAVQGINSQRNEENNLTSTNDTTTSNNNITSSSTRTIEIGDDNDDHHQNSNNNNNNTNSSNSTTHLIQAYRVVEEAQQSMDEIRADIQAQVEEEVRQTMIQDAVEANVVTTSSSPHHWSPTRAKMTIFGSVLLILALTIGLVAILLTVINPGDGGNGDNNNMGTTGPIVKNSTLDTVRERGYIRCGVYQAGFGFSLPNPTTGQLEGMNADHCRAVALAVFNNSNAVQFMTVELTNRFELLADKKIDVLATTAIHNLQRDVYFGKSTDSGFTFSKPFVYSGLAFWGPPDFLRCAETLDAETGICKNLTICVAAFTTHEFLLRSLVPHQALVPFTSPIRLVSNLDDGTCLTLAAEIFYTNARSIPHREAKAGTKLFSNEPLSLVTREDDHEWSSLVNSVINVFFFAEANGISKGNAEDLQPLVGSDLSPMLVPVIQELGNYGDLYNSHLEPLVSRHGLNTLYTSGDQSGLLYAFPLGISIGKGPEPDPDGMISRVLDRGYLKCGVVVADDRDAAMAGFDTEFCKALSAGLFGGSTEAVEITEISATDPAFKALDEGEWDVAAGMRLHLLAGYGEPTTGKGFSLSMPYYYDTTAMQAYGFVTTSDDPKWSDLVNWVAMATIHAASKGIGQTTADDMPQVGLFGKNLNLYQDVVRGVGSYDEIYRRTLELFIPQAGSGNELNHNLTGPQLFPLPFL